MALSPLTEPFGHLQVLLEGLFVNMTERFGHWKSALDRLYLSSGV